MLATADRYRQNPIGNVVTGGSATQISPTAANAGPVLYLDPANAVRGLTYNATTSTTASFFDLSQSMLNGVLNNFTFNSSTSGWNGDGTTSVSGTAGPYRLTLAANGSTNNYIQTTSPITGAGTQNFTIYSWIYPTTLPGTTVSIFDSQATAGTADQRFSSYLTTTSKYATYLTAACSTATALTTSNWYFVATTYDSTNINVYRNNDTAVTCAQTQPTAVSNWLTIGARSATSSGYTGSMGPVGMYNRALSTSELSQICKAQAARFGLTSSSCP